MEGAGHRARGTGGDAGQRGSHLPSLPFAVCLLPFALLAGLLPGVLFKRSATPAPAPPSVEEADELLSRAARAALGGRDGAVLVLDAQTGRVRASAGGRAAFEEATPPGSAVKPFTMLAALRSGSLDAGSRRLCRRHYEHEEFKINCSHPRYQTDFGPAEALANSCNYYFGRAAEALDAEAYASTLRQFGFGARTDAFDERESSGLLPREAARVPEMLGESEDLRVTPAQLATAYAALFNGGALLAPRVARAEGFTPSLRSRLSIEPAHRALLLAGMRGAVAYGTAARAGLATLPVYVFGKTGTSTPQGGWRAQGWFVGFAAPGEGNADGVRDVQADEVKLVVLVLLKRSRGAEAAEAARPVFEAYARTLGAGDVDAQGTRLSNSIDEGGASDEDDGRTLRVRLARGDATLRLPLEDYVFGVLAAEGSVETELESLKALAVAARTYAVRNLRRHARDRFDLCDTTHCQRFLPVRDVSARPDFYELARRAVRETAGEVLRDSTGHVAESYFSAACGGRTADVAKLWGEPHPPAHLRGVSDEACAAGAETWTDVIPAAQLLRALRADERSDVGARLEGVRVVRRDPSGRAETVELAGARRRVLRGWDFKIIVGRTLGWSVLKSSRFEVSRAGSAFVFRGTGFGHGLGLCQAGAHVSAARGASYRQLLARYFPGAALGELREADFGSKVDERAAVETQPMFRPAADTEPRAATGGSGLSQTGLYRTAHPFAAARGSVAVNQLRSEHFSVSYPARVARGEVEALVHTLESAYADVSGRLGRAGVGARVGSTEVVVYETTGEFVGATGRPAWVAAVTEGRRISFQPLAVLRRRGVLTTTPRHEFVHVALEALGAGRAPLWLVEGLAAHVAGEGRSLSSATPRRTRLSVEEIERGLARPDSQQEARALYAAAYAEVSALVRREGEPAVWRRALR